MKIEWPGVEPYNLLIAGLMPSHYTTIPSHKKALNITLNTVPTYPNLSILFLSPVVVLFRLLLCLLNERLH